MAIITKKGTLYLVNNVTHEWIPLGETDAFEIEFVKPESSDGEDSGSSSGA